MSIYIYIAESLDGYIAKEDRDIEWLNEIPNPEKSDYGFSEFMNKIDALIMGRNTFEKVLSFNTWPYNKPVFIFSNTLNKIPDELKGKCEIVNGDPKDILEDLINKNYLNIYIDGGKTIQSFLKEDLIDEMIITKIPILLGKGIKLFGSIPEILKFTHFNTMVYNNSLVQIHYKRERN